MLLPFEICSIFDVLNWKDFIDNQKDLIGPLDLKKNAPSEKTSPHFYTLAQFESQGRLYV